ncbi:hypothetical protein [Actinomadura terrae]|uniref:hypothetical protein n=1 Tax=Actinomadura terrae TaxID=604353 RepID=UPI001FA71D9A|nr:hypothetical protein [Actinomadura terrae]
MLALAKDSLRLAAYGDADIVATLWTAATGSYHRLCGGATNGTAWFQEVSDLCKAGLERTDVLVADANAYARFRERVVTEIDELEPVLTQAIAENGWMDVPDAVLALRMCATDVSPELAFRFALRVIIEYSCEIERDRYKKFEQLGREFCYGEYVVSRAAFLVH